MNTIKEAGLYIFDMDGTLLDSMGEWTHLGRSFLLSRQIQPPENLEDIIETMTMDESAAYFRTLGVSGDIASINHDVMQLIHDSYIKTRGTFFTERSVHQKGQYPLRPDNLRARLR